MKYFSYVSLFLDVKCSHVISYILKLHSQIDVRRRTAFSRDVTASRPEGGGSERRSRSERNPVRFQIRQRHGITDTVLFGSKGLLKKVLKCSFGISHGLTPEFDVFKSTLDF